jgi:hypothetical protein
MAKISSGVGWTPKTRFGAAIDQATDAARGAIRPRAHDTRRIFEELDPDVLTVRLRGAVVACPTVSLLAAASVSYLRDHLLSD